MPKLTIAHETAEPTLSNSRVKEFTKRLIALNAEKKEAADAIKDLMTEAKAASVDTKALKAAVRVIENPIPPEFKETVNYYIEASGQSRLFV